MTPKYCKTDIDTMRTDIMAKLSYAAAALLLVLAWGGGTAAGAQDGDNKAWDLRRCIEYATLHNITIKSEELSVQMQEVQLNSARSAYLPAASASASQNFSFGRGLTAENTYDNSNTTSTGLNLGVDVPIFQGFYRKNNLTLASLNLEASTQDLLKAKEDLGVTIAKAYVQILYDMEIVKVAKGQIEIDSLQVERLTEMVSKGKVSPSELSRQKASLSQSRLQLTQAQGNLRMAVLDLTQLLELPSPDGFSVVEPDASLLGGGLVESPEDVYAQAVRSRPSVISEEKRLQASLASIEIAKSSYYPTISLSGGVGTNYYTNSSYPSASFSSQMKSNFSQFLGLSLSVPIFDRFSTRNQVRTARLRHQTQALSLENARKALYKEIQQACSAAITSGEKLLSCEAVLAATQEAFDLTEAKYENGMAGVTEFNEARNSLMKARSDLAQARYENLLQRAIVRFYRDGTVSLEK